MFSLLKDLSITWNSGYTLSSHTHTIPGRPKDKEEAAFLQGDTHNLTNMLTQHSMDWWVRWFPLGQAKETLFKVSTVEDAGTARLSLVSACWWFKRFRILSASVSDKVLPKHRFPGKPKQGPIKLKHSLYHRHASPFPNLPQIILIFLKPYRNPGILPKDKAKPANV